MEFGLEVVLSALGSVQLADKLVSLIDVASQTYGCTHYRRRCKIRAPCCNEIYNCRHCHNEAKNSLEVNPLNRHDIPRHEIQKVICSQCGMEQDVQQYCMSCGVCMGKYFCAICKLYDDDVSKQQYHCDKCGICRTGGNENFFHCETCACCYSKLIKDSHRCVERAMHHNCPICLEFVFDTTKDLAVLNCGHTLHLDCVKEMKLHDQYTCPICSKSIDDMSSVWRQLDQEIASTPMPVMYQNRMVWILCNDCGASSQVKFHIIAHKCLACESYNTRQIRGDPAATTCSSGITHEIAT